MIGAATLLPPQQDAFLIRHCNTRTENVKACLSLVARLAVYKPKWSLVTRLGDTHTGQFSMVLPPHSPCHCQ